MEARGYDYDVFINRHFDPGCHQTLDALVLAVHDCGGRARYALEVDDSGRVRIENKVELIQDCRYGIHDISSTTPTTCPGSTCPASPQPPQKCRAAPIRFHDLRHTCATIRLMAVMHRKYVQELLGHASISITLDTYFDVIEGMDGGLAEALDDAL